MIISEKVIVINLGSCNRKNGRTFNILLIEDNCLEEERSDDSNYCLRLVHCP
jgi:hypothetical protein